MPDEATSSSSELSALGQPAEPFLKRSPKENELIDPESQIAEGLQGLRGKKERN